MTPVILVARRKDFGWRDDLWRYARERWSSLLPDFSISEGFHDGPEPFSFSAAINSAAATASKCEPDWDVCLYIGADWLAQTAAQCVEAAECSLRCGQLVFAHDQTAVLSEEGTEALLEGGSLEDALASGEWHTNTFSGVVAIPRDLWEAVGGFDERFSHWALEDMALWDACNALGRGYQRLEGVIAHLWHPQVYAEREGNPNFGVQSELWQRYRAVRNDAVGMRALLSEPGGPLA